MSVVARAGSPPRESPPGPHLKLLETPQKPARSSSPPPFALMNRNIQYLVSRQRDFILFKGIVLSLSTGRRMSETRLFSKLALGGALGFVFGADLSLGKRSLDPASLCSYFGVGYVASSIADIFSHPLDFLVGVQITGGITGL